MGGNGMDARNEVGVEQIHSQVDTSQSFPTLSELPGIFGFKVWLFVHVGKYKPIQCWKGEDVNKWEKDEFKVSAKLEGPGEYLDK